MLFYYYWGKENRSLYRGLCYIEVRYVEVHRLLFAIYCVLKGFKGWVKGVFGAYE